MIACIDHRLAVSKNINSTPERVWDILTDTTRWPEWGPSVRAVECQHRFIESNCKGYVRTFLYVRLPFRITSYDHLKFWSWQVGGFEATGHRLQDHPDGCTVIFDMPWWAFPYTVICLIALNRIAKLSISNE
jgi:hypothetical protein